MKKRLLIFVLLATLCAIQTIAQTVSGIVSDAASGKVLPRATCKVVNRGDSLLRYCIAGANGRFSMTLPPRAAELVFSCMGYEQQRITIEHAGENMEIKMLQTSHSLPDVIVKAPPITKRKDTVDYHVSSFVDKGDRHLEDVLKKMPGFEVTPDGGIKYQGRPISRFNIEGQNLLGGRYNQATRNMPVAAVSTVQVMENNQHIRALKNKVSSEETALNIKLKKDYKLKPFGEIYGGGGGLSTFLWIGAISMLNISPKNQTLITAETNNLGKSLSGEGFNNIDLTGMRTSHFLPIGMLDDITLRLLPLKSKRYLDNKSYSIALNHLFVLSRYSNLVANVSFVDQREINRDSIYNRYGGQNTFELSETNRLYKRIYTLSPSVKYELNSPKLYLEDELKGSFGKMEIENRLISNATALDNSMWRRPGHIQNHLNIILNTGLQTFSIRSFARYFFDKEALMSPTLQLLRHGQLLFENKVSTGISLFRHNIGLEYSNEYIRNNIVFANRSDASSIFTHTLQSNYIIGIGKSSFMLGLPINLSIVDLQWNRAANGKRFHIAPSVGWTYLPNSFLTIRANISYRERAGEEPLMSQPYRTNYRTTKDALNRMGWDKIWSVNFSMSYRSVLHLLTWHLNGNAFLTKSDHYTEFSYTPSGTRLRPVWQPNDQRMFYITTSLHKVIGKGLNLKTSINFNRMEMFIAQNGEQNIYKSNVISSMVDIVYANLSWLKITWSTTGNLSWYDAQPKSLFKSIYTEASLSLYPIAHLGIDISADHSLQEISKNEYRSNLFLDFSAEYQFSKRFSIALTVTNLLGRKEYVDMNRTAINYSYFSKHIRGREVISTLRFSF